MASMASRAHSRCWKTLDDTEDSLPAVSDICLDNAMSVCHRCGVCNKNAVKLIKTEDLEMFLSRRMDKTVIEVADHRALSQRGRIFFAQVI